MVKDAGEHPDGRGMWEGVESIHALSASLSQPLPVFTSPEALQIPSVWVFYGGCSTEA